MRKGNGMEIIVKNPFLQFKRNRTASYDLMKFAALIFVMLDHTFQHWNPALTQTQFYNFVFLTQMPLFFFIAGYFAYKKAVSFARFPDFVRHELRLCASYLIPCLFFCFAEVGIRGFHLVAFSKLSRPGNQSSSKWTLVSLGAFLDGNHFGNVYAFVWVY